MIYKEGKSGVSYIKRFNVTGVTRDKTYNLTSQNPKTKILHFSANPNGEAEIVTIQLRQSGSIKKLKWDLDFADLQIWFAPPLVSLSNTVGPITKRPIHAGHCRRHCVRVKRLHS